MRQAEQGAFLTDSPERTDHGMDGAWLALVSRWQQNCLDEMERGRAKREESSRYYTLWSHQIKTPVAAAHLLLQEETLDRPAMEQELFKMEQYVDMALQYQRLDKSGRDLVLQEYELEGLVKKAVKGLAAVFIYNRAALELGELAGQVLTDEKWFVFVLEQILSNAVKYAPKGKISVYLSGDRKELVIEDNGIGIRPEDIPRVFEWGYTGSNGRLEKRSTGIGLYLCRQVMNMLGQSIRIESEEGVGTRVCLGIDRYRFGVE
ncbi:MAG: ATP-binding protein [Hungatella hathewayi]